MTTQEKLNALRTQKYKVMKQQEAGLLIQLYAEDNDMTIGEALDDIESCYDLITEELRYAFSLYTGTEITVKL